MSVEQTLLAGLASALTAAGTLARLEGGPRALLASLGWAMPPGVDDIGLASLDLALVDKRLDEWTSLRTDGGASDEDQALALARLAAAVLDAIAALSDVRLQAPQDYLARSGVKDEFLTRLFDLYLVQSTAIASPQTFDVAVLLGWFELRRDDADPARFQVAHLRHVVHWDRVPLLLTDPGALMREVYGWGTAAFDATALVTRIGAVLQHLAVEVRRRELPAIPLARLQGRAPRAHTPQTQLFLTLLGSSGALAGEAGLSVFGLPPTTPGGGDGGIGIAPYAEGAATLRIPLSTRLSAGMAAQADLGSGLALVVRPGSDPVLRTGMNEPQVGTGGPGSEVQLDLTLAAPQGEAPLTLLAVAGSTLTATSLALGVDIVVDGAGTDAAIHVRLQGGRLSVSLDDLPFLESSESADGLVVESDVDLAWSHRDGMRLNGRLDLKAGKTIGRRVGPVTLNTLALALAADNGVALTATLGVTASLGPLRLIVEGFGLRSAITPGPGSLGSADLAVRFVPPEGIGVVVDASGVVGGGFLRFDQAKGEYSGALEIVIAEKLAVRATGLLVTRLPGGARGYALLILITAEGFRPIPLGLGISLSAVGGLLALNRTFDEEALRAGLRSGTLDAVLFPNDPVRNAPQILSTLNRVFPVAQRHHLFGPMVRLTWGSPVLITADLALVLEFGARLRLLILGQLVAILPRRDHDLVRLQMDAVGVIDFDRGTAALDAVLFDSRLLKKFVLTGAMAMRLQWTAPRSFALAIGGLHPAFNPPTGFPKLERVALSLTAGDNPRLRCEAYFALTSNTVQFGARAELYASAAGFSLLGQMGFDVLIQLDPFAFLAEFHAQVQLKRGATNLFKVRVEGAIAGPRPLHLKAKATFEILWWDVTVRVDRTLVAGERPPPPEPIDVLPRLKEALGNPANWTGQLPDGQRPLVTLRQGAGGAADVLVHPFATLTVKQTVVPLDVEIARFGQAAPAGARRFTLSVDGQAPAPVQDFFAPAQFFELSDDEKLSRPSFEPLAAGVRISSTRFDLPVEAGDWLGVDAIAYETWIVDDRTKSARRSEGDAPPAPAQPPRLYTLSAERLSRQARFGAAGSSDLRRAGNARYRTPGAKYRVQKEGWSIVAADDLAVRQVPGVDAGKLAAYSEAAEALRHLAESDPQQAAGLTILRLSDVRTPE